MLDEEGQMCSPDRSGLESDRMSCPVVGEL